MSSEICANNPTTAIPAITIIRSNEDSGLPVICKMMSNKVPIMRLNADMESLMIFFLFRNTAPPAAGVRINAVLLSKICSIVNSQTKNKAFTQLLLNLVKYEINTAQFMLTIESGIGAVG